MSDPAQGCPFCRGNLTHDLVVRIRSAKRVGKPMTPKQFMRWLKHIR